jgi:1,4-alpha-glucan branching enzyme
MAGDQDEQRINHERDRRVTAGLAQATTEEERAAPVVTERAARQPSESAKASTVDVTFTLPAEIHADSVALCGEFNQWSAEDIQLERGGDGNWLATLALEPGRSYRYRYLLDGERWENAWQADRYVPNPYGSTDSVIIVEPHSEN